MSEQETGQHKPKQKRNVKIRSISLSPAIDQALNDLMQSQSEEKHRTVGRSEIINKLLSHYLFKK